MKSVAEGSGKRVKSQPRNRAAASEGPVLGGIARIEGGPLSGLASLE